MYLKYTGILKCLGLEGVGAEKVVNFFLEETKASCSL